MTNADKIRSMSVDRLAKIIEDGKSVFDCNKCQGKTNGSFCTRERCFPYIKKWLESEAT